MILVPAYGRDYKSAAEVRKDWEAGKDFKIMDISAGRWDGSYTSIRDTEGDSPAWKAEGSYIRYNSLQDIVFIGKWDQTEEGE